MSFSSLQALPADPILSMGQLFNTDENPNKVNLSVGIYLDNQGRTPVMAAVKQAEQQLIDAQNSKAYVAQRGDAAFLSGVQSLLLADSVDDQSRLTSVATPGGCGGLRIASELLRAVNPDITVWMSTPTWANHRPLISGCGLNIGNYRYYDFETGEVNFEHMMADLQQAKPGDAVLLHACCHNPTGADLDKSQWQQVIELCQHNNLIPFIDIAYQGLGSGLDDDAYGVRCAMSQLPEVIVVASCSKNFGLYRERTGALLMLGRDQQQAENAQSHAMSLARCSYSMSPYHGCGIVGLILQDPQLRQTWETELQAMNSAIKTARQQLADGLNAAQNVKSFDFIVRNQGMFSYLGLSVEQCQRLRQQYAIYLLDSSRINLVGLNASNIDYSVAAICDVLES